MSKNLQAITAAAKQVELASQQLQAAAKQVEFASQQLQAAVGVHPGTGTESIPTKNETRHLAELKAVAAEHAAEEGRPVKGGEAATAQSATGKYAAAIAIEHGVPTQVIQSSVRTANYLVDEQKLAGELREEASVRQSYEQTSQGFIPRDGPAAKVQSAADKMERVISMEQQKDTSGEHGIQKGASGGQAAQKGASEHGAQKGASDEHGAQRQGK